MEPNTVEQESSLNSVVANSSSFQEAAGELGADRKEEILFAARNCKKLSPEMGGRVMGEIRNILYKRMGIEDEAKFGEFLRRKAEEEENVSEDERKTLSQAAVEFRKAENSETEKKYNAAVSAVSRKSPAAFVLHFWDNKDLKWLTGLTEENTGEQFSRLTDAGRLLDGLGGDLAQFATKTGRRW